MTSRPAHAWLPRALNREIDMIYPDQLAEKPDNTPHQRMWGFADSGFAVESGHIVMRSDRYAAGGVPLEGLAPFVLQAVGVAFDANLKNPLNEAYCPAARQCSALLTALRGVEDNKATLRVEQAESVRLRHGHGHHLEEIFKVLFSQLERVPDVVVFPQTEAAVAKVIQLAVEHNALLIPFGGGSCVSMALSVSDAEERPVISVDLSKMNKVLWIDAENSTACIQAGAVGTTINEVLALHGFTMGHEPDSLEFSTLGGWIATNASGMKKNRYGNIEDQILDFRLLSEQGIIEHAVAAPRVSHGIDARRLALGSEGRLGVITQATVRIHRLPEEQRYGSLVFPDWQQGLKFMKALSQLQSMPASVRLVDNLQFQFGRALKPKGSPLKSALQKFLVEKVKGIDTSKMVACTLVYEGKGREQIDLERRVNRLAGEHGGFAGGSSAGKDGYHLTFGIAYIRDFLLQHWTLGDSFETSVPWTQVDAVIDGVKEAVQQVHQERKIPGHPFVTARISQPYTSGCCIYFYIGFYYRGVEEPLSAFVELEHAARSAILKAGGALSHHHGIGKLRSAYLPQVKSQGALEWVQSVTEALDPSGIFQNGNQQLPGTAAEASKHNKSVD